MTFKKNILNFEITQHSLMDSVSKLFNFLFISFCILVLTFSTVFLLTQNPYADAQSAQFNPNLVAPDDYLYGINSRFSSPQAIEKHFCDLGSVLCQAQFQVIFPENYLTVSQELYQADPLLVNKPDYLKPYINYQKYKNQYYSAAQMIWMIAREDLGNVCYYADGNYYDASYNCINNRERPVNPGFIIAKLQQEQSLVEGTIGRSPSEPDMIYKFNRAMGSGCPESGCDSEMAGFFNQLFFGMRKIRARAQNCLIGEPAAFVNSRGVHKIGATMQMSVNHLTPDTQAVTFANAVTCSLYIYTPHIDSQETFWKILNRWNFSSDLIAPNYALSNPETINQDQRLVYTTQRQAQENYNHEESLQDQNVSDQIEEISILNQQINSQNVSDQDKNKQDTNLDLPAQIIKSKEQKAQEELEYQRNRRIKIFESSKTLIATFFN